MKNYISDSTQIIKNKNYYVAQIKSSKANQFIQYYHYSHRSFKKATLNLGIFSNLTNKLVGVSQWGWSVADNIRLDRYVKEPITKEVYYELNRFSMADTEPRNSESQAISLSIKWIKKYDPEIKLLVSYAGRKEGNYGYIYQATNWEYLGYFVSSGFWTLDGEEIHQTTVWQRYNKGPYNNLPFLQGLCAQYKSIIRTWSKQFIYIQRLDKSLTPATPILPYPKITDGPIVEKIIIYKNEPFQLKDSKSNTEPIFYYEPNEVLYGRDKLIRDNVIEKIHTVKHWKVARYDMYGQLVEVQKGVSAFKPEYYSSGIKNSAINNKFYKDSFFKLFELDEEPPEEIDVPIVAIIDEIAFKSITDIGKYTGVSKQAVSQARQRNSKQINGFFVEWYNL